MRKAIVTLAAVAAVAGCGGEGGEKGGGDRANAEDGVSKSEYVAQADAICADANQQRQSFQTPELFERPLNFQRIERYAKKLDVLFASAMGKLRALEPPQKDAATVDEILAKFERAVGMSDDFVAAQRSQDPQVEGENVWWAWVEAASEAQTLAAKHGLQDCASFGTP
ncbi:MAG: hypothetical protein M3322_02770 [Actinomycetota bacterium]|nr:hypothetical protein [Actinomycetota bacterium]